MDSNTSYEPNPTNKRKLDKVIVGKSGIYKHLTTKALEIYKKENLNDTHSVKMDMARFIHILIQTFHLKNQKDLSSEDIEERSIEFFLQNNELNDAEQLRQLYDLYGYSFDEDTILDLIVVNGPKQNKMGLRIVQVSLSDRIISVFKKDLIPRDSIIFHNYIIENIPYTEKIKILNALLTECDNFKDAGNLLSIHGDKLLENKPKDFSTNNPAFREFIDFLTDLFIDRELNIIFALKFHDLEGKVRYIYLIMKIIIYISGARYAPV